MNNKTMRWRLLTSSIAGGAALFALGATAAQAATDTDTATASTTVGEVVITGSRIPTPNLTSVSPIQTVTDKEFKLQGTTDAVDMINNLPQEFQNNKADFSNTGNPLTGPGGVSTADLRGLGPQRTLVLINGRRLGIGDPNTGDPNPAPDLDQIPTALIDHVEVLTGGASATYGSDAIGGVVNFIMKKDFEGVQLDAQYGSDNHTQHNGLADSILNASGITPPSGSVWAGANSSVSLVMGASAPDGKGNVTGYFEFRHAEPVLEGQVDWGDCLMNLAAGVCQNSSNSNRFNIATTIAGQTQGHTLTVLGTNLLAYPQAGTSPPATFNSSPYEFMSRLDTRYLGGFYAHYDIAPWAQAYAEASFMSDRTQTQVAPSGSFQTDGTHSTNCNNPLLSAEEMTALCGVEAGTSNTVSFTLGRRNIEGGPRIFDYSHQNFRIVAGMKGDFADNVWHYDVYGSYYYTSQYFSGGNFLSISAIQNALLVGGTAANPTCLSGASGCVPWNIWTQGGVTPAQTAYLATKGTSFGSTTEQIFEGNLRGDLGKYGVKSPWAKDGIQVDFGVMNRWDFLSFAPDQAQLSGDLAGGSGASVSVNKGLTVNEVYFETRIPVVQDMPFAQEISLDGGYRYSNYSTTGGVSTYKVGGQWAPVQDIRFRASYDHAIRAASILELYTPSTVTQTSVVGVDPCAPGTDIHGNPVAATATLAQCMNTGVTAAQYGNGLSTDTIAQCIAQQCSTATGGNPNLKPEVADSYSVGFTVQPTFLKGFSGSLDYWNGSIHGIIGTIPLTTSLQNCLAGIDTAVYCANVHRGPAGQLSGNTFADAGYIIGFNQNVAYGATSGIDIQGDYRLPLDKYGSLAFHLTGTALLTAKTQNLAGAPVYDCAGLYGPTCQTVNPRWRHIASLTWNTPWNVLGRIQWRYIGGTSLDGHSTQPGLAGTVSCSGCDNYNTTLPGISYLDLAAEWRVNSLLTIRAGANNILDQDPPLISQGLTGTGEPNTYPTYDLLGRQVFVAATAKF
ncbi:MAG: TonB-dependent receptor plug domain-containing protein [Caulobacterales bacterium]